MTDLDYPAPPWRMHGEAAFAPYLVDTRTLTLPPGFEVATPGRFTVGLLGYVRYLEPSPLTYDELIWMPAFVRAPAFGPRAKGWFVSVMYVSEMHTLRGGRQIWKLPKTLARFDVRPGGCDVHAEDGTEMAIRVRPFGPKLPARGRIATLQYNDGISLCRFTGDSRGSVRAARVDTAAFASNAPAWMGFDRGKRLPGPGMMQDPFVSDMQVPTFVRKV